MAGGAYLVLIEVSGALWVAAFALFIVRYAPVLLSHRVDPRDAAIRGNYVETR